MGGGQASPAQPSWVTDWEAVLIVRWWWRLRGELGV